MGQSSMGSKIMITCSLRLNYIQTTFGLSRRFNLIVNQRFLEIPSMLDSQVWSLTWKLANSSIGINLGYMILFPIFKQLVEWIAKNCVYTSICVYTM